MMKKYILIAIALLFVVCAGASDGFQTATRDLKHDTPMYSYCVAHDTTWAKWYEGGDNQRWNPSFPSFPWLGIWYADAWHTGKFGWIYAYAIALALLAAGYFDGWKKRALAFVIVWTLAQGFEGETFRVFYGNICRNNPTESVLQILADINPFINTH